jgi:site-specific recombinase XerD
MAGIIDSRQADELREVLRRTLDKVCLTERTVESTDNKAENTHYLENFLAAKRVEGCSQKTLDYYEATIEKLFESVGKLVKDVTTDDLRSYLSKYQEDNGSSKVTIDNIRRIFSSFFSWLEDEDYIVKSPVRRIHKVKTAKIIKEAFSDEDLEVLRDTCENVRDLALVEMLASTGIRVGELVRLNRTDIDFNERSCIVFGKGESEREVYFDARTKLHLSEYLGGRADDSPALFASSKSPHDRLTISGVERVLKKLGEEAEIAKVHPHRFRRTLATMAIDKGMPIEQVQKLLGHVKIDTTLHYAQVNQSNVKNAHRKFIG